DIVQQPPKAGAHMGVVINYRNADQVFTFSRFTHKVLHFYQTFSPSTFTRLHHEQFSTPAMYKTGHVKEPIKRDSLKNRFLDFS
ncbi:hypothetical protein L0244_33275, partial [bacterium]|nr:hypothetical protein [bacterium]